MSLYIHLSIYLSIYLSRGAVFIGLKFSRVCVAETSLFYCDLFIL